MQSLEKYLIYNSYKIDFGIGSIAHAFGFRIGRTIVLLPTHTPTGRVVGVVA
jgi:hypothetical protein